MLVRGELSIKREGILRIEFDIKGRMKLIDDFRIIMRNIKRKVIFGCWRIRVISLLQILNTLLFKLTTKRFDLFDFFLI